MLEVKTVNAYYAKLIWEKQCDNVNNKFAFVQIHLKQDASIWQKDKKVHKSKKFEWENAENKKNEDARLKWNES